MSKHAMICRQPRRIAIFRALQLGDLLTAVPALRALRQRYPRAEITLIGLPWAASFVQRYAQYLDRFVEFAGYPGIAEVPYDPERGQRFLAEQRAYGYDLAIQMHGSGQTSNPFVLELNAPLNVGYYEGEPPEGLTLSRPYPHHQPEIVRNLGLAELLGADVSQTGLEFPLFEQDYAEAATLLRKLPKASRPWIGLHPGSRPPARRWPAEYFAAVADTLARRFDAQIILTGGPVEEMTVEEVIRYMQAPAINLAGQTSLGGLAAIISKLDLFISNDTGPAHIADAVHCPGVTIFGPAEYERWKPLSATRHAVRQPVPCSPCSFWECPIDHRCLRWLNPERVIDSAASYLSKQPLREMVGATTKDDKTVERAGESL
jgi:lipopolysaccharide heptosyltransferase II